MAEKIQDNKIQAVVFILWPSFLTAILAIIVFFSYFAPSELYWCSSDIADCNYKIYTVGFLLFWALTLITSVLTRYFCRSTKNLNE